MNYGKAIRIARSITDLSQSELAKKSKLDASHVSLIEKGSRKPSLDALERISRALGIPQHLLSLLAADADDLNVSEQDRISTVARLLAELIAGNGAKRKGNNHRKRRAA